MPNNTHVPVCPFYIDEKRKSISCEDTYRGFKNTTEKYAWMETYCDSWDWMRCPYAADLTEAYERLEKGDGKALENHKEEAMRKEMKGLSIKLGKAEKRIERQQKKIDELRAVNKSFINKNDELYKKWRDADRTMALYEENVAAHVQQIVDAYETRLAYLIDKHGALYDSDVDEWRESRSFALVYDKDEDGYPCWQVRFEDEKKKGEE